MSRHGGIALSAVLLLALTASPSPSSADDEPGIVLLVPQTSLTEGSDHVPLSGLWIDLPGLAAERARVAISRVQVTPFARIFRTVPSGENYCTPLVARNAERENDYRWLVPTQRIIFSVFVLKDRIDPPRASQDLKGQRILNVRGISSAQLLIRIGAHVDEAKDIEQAVRMLQSGRASGVLIGHVGAWMAEKTGVALREAVRLAETTGYFACSAKLDDAIAERLRDALRAIYASGEDRLFAASDGLGAYYEEMRPIAGEPRPSTQID